MADHLKKKLRLFFFVAPGPWQDACYVDRSRFEEVELQFGPTWFPIRGTLTLPLGEGPFPAAILLHGSGPQDRDETIGGNKPFRDLAQGLASRGIAVLRFDKRTYSHGLALSVLLPRLTVKEEILNDAVTAFQTLIQQPRIDIRRIAMVGHSLGGTVLPRVHEMEPRVAGLAFLAAASRPLEDLTWDQVNYLFAADGQVDEAERETLELLKKAVMLVKSEQLTADTPASELPLGVPASYWLDLRQHDPVKEAQQISVPMVFMQGERDYQVTGADFSRWRQALETRSDVTFRSFPQLNHLLMPGAGPAGPAEYFEPGHVEEEVITELANFIQNLTPREFERENP